MRLVEDRVWGILTVWAEARGEPWEGQVAVAEVIRNRAERARQSIAHVVLMPAQFSCWSTNDPNRLSVAELDDEDDTVREIAAAWDTAQAGSDLARGATHYLNPDATRALHGGVLPSWARDPHDPTRLDPAKLVATYGRHAFLQLI